MNTITTSDVLLALVPADVEFSVIGDTYEGIEWVDEDYIGPSREVFDAKKTELEAAVPWTKLRDQRNKLLAETDYLALSDVTMSSEMTTYRQALRDLPANTTDPANPVWPTKPEA